MGFYSTTLEQEKPHQKTSDCAQKTASGKFFTSNRNRTYQIERNPLETQQEKLTTTRETASGVFFYKYRHYSAELGRWLGRDPIEEDGGVNLYGFVGNKPLNEWDRLGLTGKLVIKTKGTGRKMFGVTIGTTSWLEYTPDSDVEFNGKIVKKGVTYYSHNYGNNNGPKKKPGVNNSKGANKSGVTPTQSRTMYITCDQEQNYLEYVKKQTKLGAKSWSYLHTCVDFATDGWEIGTGEDIDGSNGVTLGSVLNDKQIENLLGKAKLPNGKLAVALAKLKGLHTPHNLGNAINKLNGGGDHKQVNKPNDPLCCCPKDVNKKGKKPCPK